MHFLIGLLLLSGVSQFLANNEGETCNGPNGQGICTKLSECRSAMEELKSGSYPQVCGYVGLKVLVCCLGMTSGQPVDTEKSTITETSAITTATKPGDISKMKCKDYSKYAYRQISVLPLINTQPSTILHECSLQTELLITGWRPTVEQFPHIAQIGFSTDSSGLKWYCAGSIISENFILTAAHCFNSRAYGQAEFVRVGMTESDASEQIIKIAELIAHPKFMYSSAYHDIGLVKLEKNITFNTYTRPACLNTGKTSTDERAISSEWNFITDFEDRDYYILKKVIKYVNVTTCNSVYDGVPRLKNGIDNEYMMCYDPIYATKDVCEETSSGGPLQNIVTDSPDLKCMYSLIGVSSITGHCGLPKNIPTVYTKVSAYIKWIEDTVWA